MIMVLAFNTSPLAGSCHSSQSPATVIGAVLG
jgi:hypothetical protein